MSKESSEISWFDDIQKNILGMPQYKTNLHAKKIICPV